MELDFPRCLEYLDTIMKKSKSVTEDLKQLCVPFALMTYNGDKLCGFFKYLEKVGGNSAETDFLIRLNQMYHDYNRTNDDPASAMAQIALVLRIAKDCIGPDHGK